MHHFFSNLKGPNGVWDLKKNFALLELLERLEDAAKEKENVFSTTFLERERELSVCCDENEDHIAVVYCTTCATHLCEQVCTVWTVNNVVSR